MPFLDDQAGLVQADIARLISVGDIIMSGVSTPRSGFLACDGSTLDQVTYAALFAAIGTTYNTGGEPVGTFRIPAPMGRSPMGAGAGGGLTPRTAGQYFGEENHVLTQSELASHTHTQVAHTHVQNAHGHSVTDPGHNHTQVAHTHIQNQHLHAVSITTGIESANHVHGPGAGNRFTNCNAPGGAGYQATGGSLDNFTLNSATTGGVSANHTHSVSGNTVNQTPTNQNFTALNNANTTGLTVDNATATNQDATAVNNSTGSDAGHNTVHPCWVCYFYIRYM